MDSLNFETEMEADGQGSYSLFPALDSMSSLTGAAESLDAETPSEVADKPNLTWLDAAQIVLEEAGRPMHIKEIKQRIIDRGLVQSNAKSSLEAVMYREVRLEVWPNLIYDTHAVTCQSCTIFTFVFHSVPAMCLI